MHVFVKDRQFKSVRRKMPRQVHRSIASQKKFSNDIVKYIKTNLARNLRIIDVAKYFGCERRTITLTLTKYKGTIFKDLRKSLRAEKIRADIEKAGKHSIYQIYLESGYTCTRQFRDVFKEVFGCTAEEYRAQLMYRIIMQHLSAMPGEWITAAQFRKLMPLKVHKKNDARLRCLKWLSDHQFIERRGAFGKARFCMRPDSPFIKDGKLVENISIPHRPPGRGYKSKPKEQV